MQDQVVNDFEGPYFPFNRREHYPRQLKVDFRKLTRKTLLSYTAHHDLHVRPDSTHEELAVAAARHFAGWRVNEEATMRSFITRMTVSAKHGLKRKHTEKSLDQPLPRSPERREQQRSQKRQRHHGLRLSTRHGHGYGEKDTTGNKEKEREVSPPPLSKRHGEEALRSNSLPRYATRGSGIAPTVIPAYDGSSSDDTEFDEGEQVAAYMARSWILARVVRAVKRGQYNRRQVELQDEDDASHVFVLPLSDVIQLRDISSDVHKGDKVMAVFPDTTMFYCATIATDTPQMENSKMMTVKFEDDGDENGEPLLRRVSVEHVILEDELPQRGTRKKSQSNKVGTTYADMIEHALSNLEDGRGTLANICDIIEKDFRDVLNWKLENDTRKTPVWRSSVRKILFSNSRFSHRSNTPDQGYIFFMALNGNK